MPIVALRDEIGIARGTENLPWLWTGTLGVTLLLLGLNFILNPVKAKPKEPAPVPATPPAALVHSRQP